MATKGKTTDVKEETTEATAAPSGAEVKESEGTGGQQCVCRCQGKEEKVVPSIGKSIVYRDGETIRAAIITAHRGDTVDLVYFQGLGSGHVGGARAVKKGLKPGQWWTNENDLHVADHVLNG